MKSFGSDRLDSRDSALLAFNESRKVIRNRRSLNVEFHSALAALKLVRLHPLPGDCSGVWHVTTGLEGRADRIECLAVDHDLRREHQVDVVGRSRCWQRGESAVSSGPQNVFFAKNQCEAAGSHQLHACWLERFGERDEFGS